MTKVDWVFKILLAILFVTLLVVVASAITSRIKMSHEVGPARIVEKGVRPATTRLVTVGKVLVPQFKPPSPYFVVEYQSGHRYKVDVSQEEYGHRQVGDYK